MLLASITVLLGIFFWFVLIFNNFFIIFVVKENTRLKPILVIPSRTPIILEKEIINIPPLVTDKTIEVLSK